MSVQTDSFAVSMIKQDKLDDQTARVKEQMEKHLSSASNSKTEEDPNEFRAPLPEANGSVANASEKENAGANSLALLSNQA